MKNLMLLIFFVFALLGCGILVAFLVYIHFVNKVAGWWWFAELIVWEIVFNLCMFWGIYSTHKKRTAKP